MPLDFDTEIAKIAEAFCIQNQLPVTRRFTDEELQDTLNLLEDSRQLAEYVESQAREQYGL
jgi:cell division protein FtsB